MARTQALPLTARGLMQTRRRRDPAILDRRGILFGVLLLLAAGVGTTIWKIAGSGTALKTPQEFQFEIADPKVEDFKLRDPVRDILQEKKEETPDIEEEKPDIHMTVTPTEVQPTEEVIQSKQIEIDTPKIDLQAKEMTIQDAPEEITQVNEIVVFAPDLLSVEAMQDADIYKYKEPAPRDKPIEHLVNMAPAPGKPLKVFPKAFGEQDAPSFGELGPANINLFGTGEFFRTMSRFGDIRARTAVDAALHWLAVHQEFDGTWNAAKYEGNESGNVAVTGLATIAFLGGGHTIRKGEYSRNVLKAVKALIRGQSADGCMAAGNGHLMYTHAICTIALCEAYGRARDEDVGRAAQRAVAYCEQNVNPDCGWRYQPKTNPSDTSVTAWFMQALKAAKLANLSFDHKVFSQGLAFLDSVTDQGGSKESSGGVGYTFAPEQTYGAGHPALTAAGMMIRQFDGMGVRNPLLVKGAELTRAQEPDWGKKDFYTWYYATYAMHNMGGEYRLWWNKRIRDVLLEHQSRQGDSAGSWDPKGDKWGTNGGRVYTTALGALCLEVYYRYSESLNSFGAAPDIDDLLLMRPQQ